MSADLPPGSEGAKTCPACGTDNRLSARFCRSCGANLVSAPAHETPRSHVTAEAPLFTGAADRRSAPDRKALMIALAAAGGLIVCAAMAFVLLARPFAKPVTEFATDAAEVRAAPDSAALAMGALQRDTSVSGRWVTGSDHQSRWLKIKWQNGGGYVDARELSEAPRPMLSASTLPISPTAVLASPVRSEPEDGAAVVDTVGAGGPVQVVGTTQNGWAEIVRRGGGVGYVKVEVVQAPPLPAPPPPPAAPGQAADQIFAPTTDAAAAASADAAQAAATAAAAAAAQASAEAARANANSGVVPGSRYACSPAPEQSVNPIPDAGALSLSVDETRSCVNDRVVYLRGTKGGLKRVMLNDNEHRASLLFISPDRATFARIDYFMPLATYARLRQANGALVKTRCSPPGDLEGARTAQGYLAVAMPRQDLRLLPGAIWRRTVWRCVRSG